ncbi:uncharacterized protein BCR38DRAFT_446144 [Pseudomassariella vexata]|uniref:Uncharacterized protein n=1 Tax=Pseudomassariella vexata TaxID=1141098 RepID=A0A1Y2DJ94_9PEZI|nr:uncharacterized protein BCR38DRAFT_446144 [Pseudomassariella vexata]ORY59282.1 hypothetical protein BCR38DRAFT_446144 [Pseudomassariella vexata]
MILACQALQSQPELNIRCAAQLYNVPRTTLFIEVMVALKTHVFLTWFDYIANRRFSLYVGLENRDSPRGVLLHAKVVKDL